MVERTTRKYHTRNRTPHTQIISLTSLTAAVRARPTATMLRLYKENNRKVGWLSSKKKESEERTSADVEIITVTDACTVMYLRNGFQG